MLFESIAGGLLGLVGTFWNTWNQRKVKELEIQDAQNERDHQIKLIAAQTQATIEEAKAQMEIVKTQVAGAVDLEEVAAYRDSIKEGNKSSLSSEWVTHLLQGNVFSRGVGSIVVMLLGFSEFLKEIMRPTLTTYLVGLSTWISLKAFSILALSGEALTKADALGIVRDVVDAMIMLTVSCVTWWFGDRMTAKVFQNRMSGKRG